MKTSNTCRLMVLALFGLLSGRGNSSIPNDQICDFIDQEYLCGDSPQGCASDEDGLNCIVYDNGNFGCSQCATDYFRYDYDYKCIECDLLSRCQHCTNGAGCQQCDNVNECNIVSNECGLNVCDCGDDTPSPTESTTPITTEDEVDLEESINGLRDAFDKFWLSRNESILSDMRSFYDNNGDISDLICWGGFNCSTLHTFFDRFAGLCDGGTISLFDSVIFQDLRVIYGFYRACINYNNNFGLFWINGVGITKYKQDGKIEEMTVNWRNYDDIVPILEQYLQSQ